ncbi:MAG: Trm112 family protein [Planctomycetota bacterium]|nr:Trm112 family protein [Planctomycetota bacterium]
MSEEKELLDILCCPVCHGEFVRDEDWLVCQECKRRYPIRDGIYVLLASEAVMPAEGAISTESQP